VVEANLDEVRALPGVRDAFVLQGNGVDTELKPGVAILARDTWSAFSARRSLRVRWDESAAAGDDMAETLSRATSILTKDGAEEISHRGNVPEALGKAAQVVAAEYRYAFASHAQLEPQNATAWWKPDGTLEAWAPTQTPQWAVTSIARLLAIPESAVVLHAPRMGGAFGRRLMNDVACEAAAIARRADRPVKLQWTREDDMTNDFVRVGGLMALKGGLDDRGRAVAWQNHVVTFSADGKQPVSGGDLKVAENLASLLPHFRQQRTQLPWRSPCGFWRSPGPSAFAFPLQGFLHEMSVAAKRDHLEFLLEILGEPRWLTPGDRSTLHTGRAAEVLRLAAAKAGWGSPAPAGRARGIAFYFSHAAYAAHVAEVSVDAERLITVHRITVAADVGPVVNLEGAEAQCQGSIIDALSVMAAQKLTYAGGRVLETNFDRYPLRRIGGEPAIAMHFVQSDYAPSGLGEPILPPVAPAVCNAVYAASGHRIRTLPISEEGFALQA
jgi:isoquinoline 1-oxidoreductase beta subunit